MYKWANKLLQSQTSHQGRVIFSWSWFPGELCLNWKLLNTVTSPVACVFWKRFTSTGMGVKAFCLNQEEDRNVYSVVVYIAQF